MQAVTRPPGVGPSGRGRGVGRRPRHVRRLRQRARRARRVGRAPLGPGVPYRRVRAGRTRRTAGRSTRKRRRATSAPTLLVERHARRRPGVRARLGLRRGARERHAAADERHADLRRLGRDRLRRRGGAARGRRARGARARSTSRRSARSPRTARARTSRASSACPPAPSAPPSQHARSLGKRHRLLAGVEGSWVDGTTEETVFVRGAATSRVDAGGTALAAAAFVQDLWQPHPRLLVTGSLRLDGWRLRNGQSTATPLNGGATVSTAYGDRGESALSPRLGVLFRASSAVSHRRLGVRRLPRADAQRAVPLVPPGRHAHPREPGARGRAAAGRGSRGARGPRPGRATADRLRFERPRRGRERDGLDHAWPRHAPAPERRPRPSARRRGRGRAEPRRARLRFRGLRVYRLARRELPRRADPGGPPGPAGAAAPGHVPGAVRQRVAPRRPGALHRRGVGRRPQHARPRPGVAARRAGRPRGRRRRRAVRGRREPARRGDRHRAHARAKPRARRGPCAPGSGSCAPGARGRSDGSGTEGGRNRKRTTNGADHSLGLSRNLANDPG